MMKNKKLIVVLGMHRSGTSSITRGLKVFGVDLGKRLMPPVEGINEKGFWEDIDLTDLNVEILDALGGNWNSHTQINSKDVGLLREKGFFERSVEVLQNKAENSEIYGFKDPRVAKLLPFWKEVFEHCHFDVHYVLALRNPLSVAKSLSKRDSLEREQSYLLWLDHVITSLRNNSDCKTVVVDYDLLMEQPEHELKRLSKELELAIDQQELMRYTTEFLDYGLRHTTFQPSDLVNDHACPKIVSEIYIALLDVAKDKITLPDTQFQLRLASWFAEFDRIDPIFNLLDKLLLKVKHGEQSNVEFIRLKESEVNLTHMVHSRDDQIQHRHSQILHIEEQIRYKDELIHHRDEQIHHKDEQILHKEDQINQLNLKISQQQVRISRLEAHVAKLSLVVEELNSSIKAIFSSNSWKVTGPVRSAITVARKIRTVIGLIPQLLAFGGGLGSSIRKMRIILRNEGLEGVRKRVRFVFANQHNAPDISPAKNSSTKLIPFYVDPDLDKNVPDTKINGTVALHVHLNSPDGQEQCFSYLKNIPFQFHLFVSLAYTSTPKKIVNELQSSLVNATKIVVESVPEQLGQFSALIMHFGCRVGKYDFIGQISVPSNFNCNAELGEWQSGAEKLLGPVGSSGGRIARLLSLLETGVDLISVEPIRVRASSISTDRGCHELAQQFLNQKTRLPAIGGLESAPCFGDAFWLKTKSFREFFDLSTQLRSFIEGESIGIDVSESFNLELANVFFNRKEGRCLLIMDSDAVSAVTEYEEQHDYSDLIADSDVKVLSYYLPQFHPTPENDLWHGKGFTEWTKVRAANPLFEGHYQQHFPHPDIGYYHLDSPDVLVKQADMMIKAGVHGQIFYHYWFSGKLILEHPAQLLLAHPEIAMPYCFCWANENWTRRWDGNDQEILLGQNYSEQDAIDFIRYLIPFFKDPRYIKVDERPMLQVYRPSSMPDVRQYLDIWHSECLKEGVQPPYMVAVLTRGATHPHDFGMDAGVERVLHDWTAGAVVELKETLNSYWPVNGSVLPYNDVANHYMSQTEKKDFTYFRSIVPIWDNTARYGSDAYVIHGSTPEKFQKWMESSVRYTVSTLAEDRRFLVVNAWNEWAEGAHLEPDSRYGYSYLNSIGRALSGIPYSDENSVINDGNTKKVHIKILPPVLELLQHHAIFKKRFVNSLKKSEILDVCSVTTNSKELIMEFPQFKFCEDSDCDFICEFRQPAYFDSLAIESLLNKASSTDAVVIPNTYGNDFSIIETESNGAVDAKYIAAAPMVVIPRKVYETKYKNVRLCLQARSYATAPESPQATSVVTTIIRFHKSGNFSELKNALFCLYAMNNCVVIPSIAAQDLDPDQISELNNIINSFVWEEGFEPEVTHYQSKNGAGDLRSKMLNNSLKNVKSRYATFLDFDDLLMPFSYSWLINRLNTTGKAVTFGRVYWTDLISQTGQIIGRKRAFEYGYSYAGFVDHNHAPLHSYMLDMSKLDLRELIYFDDHTYMEDYLLTLQLFSADNGDWDSLKENFYLGDYIHCVDRSNTLAIHDDYERDALLVDPHYVLCDLRVKEIRGKIKKAQFM